MLRFKNNINTFLKERTQVIILLLFEYKRFYQTIYLIDFLLM